MKALSREDILKVQDILIEKVEVPEWSGSVHVKGLTASERSAMISKLTQKKGKNSSINMDRLREELAVVSICDEGGKLLFKKNDVSALSEKSASAMERVFKVSSKLSGLGSDDVEELTEEMESDPLEDSVSD